MDQQRTYEEAKQVVHEMQRCSTLQENLDFYDTWAQTYDEDLAAFDYNAPAVVAQSVSRHFKGHRTSATVLDVACGTGNVTKRLKEEGFSDFVGIDGSQGMLEKARETGLYKELKLCLIGEEPLPVPKASFDLVVIVGSLRVNHVPYSSVRELCDVAKPGGFICMTTSAANNNVDYKAALEQELRLMEEQGLWVSMEITQVSNWRKSSDKQDSYVPGNIYLYKKL